MQWISAFNQDLTKEKSSFFLSFSCITMLVTGSPGNLPFQICYLYQRTLPSDNEKRRTGQSHKNVRVEYYAVYVL